jgi:hypothetical protein
MRAQLLGKVTPVHFVGESHCVAYDGILFRAPWAEEYFLCKSSFLFWVKANEFLSEKTGLHTSLLEALASERLVDAQYRPAHLTVDAKAVRNAVFSERPLIAPPIVLFAGDMDFFRGDFLQPIGNDYDFELPDDPGYGVNRSKQPMPFASVRRRIETVFRPFVNCMERLQGAGFSRIMVHCLPARIADEARTSKAVGYHIDKAVQAKATVAANRYLAQACRQAGVPFIDVWPETTGKDGFLLPELDLDGVHLKQESTAFSLYKIAAELFDRTAGIQNEVRYYLLAQQAGKYDSSGSESLTWAENGIVVSQVDPGAVTQLSQNLVFEGCAENRHARLDWCGWPRQGRPGIIMATPAPVDLERAANLLGSGVGHAILHAGATMEMTVVSFRPLRIASAGNGAIPASTLAAPQGTRRAVLYLGGEGELEVRSGDGAPLGHIRLIPGALAVYDPHRVQICFRPGAAPLDVVELALIPRIANHPFRVVGAGLNDWPADPFQYSVAGMPAYPPFEGSSVRVTSATLT